MCKTKMGTIKSVESFYNLISLLDFFKGLYNDGTEEGFFKYAKRITKIIEKAKLEDSEVEYEIELALYDFYYGSIDQKRFYKTVSILSDSVID